MNKTNIPDGSKDVTARIEANRRELDRVATIPCDAGNLESFYGPFDRDELNPNELLKFLMISQGLMHEWSGAEKIIEKWSIPDRSGGVNPGDRQAIFHLVRYLKPVSILEIGTHIGSSTIALDLATDRRASIVTVDIKEVNNPEVYAKFGAKHPPIDMVPGAQFVKQPSLDYLAKTQATFDFIFLDGHHGAQTVYQEIPLALKRLNPSGLILLHDYFPDQKPLWNNGAVIAGPEMAVQRLISEGADIRAVPFGELPWPTKLDSCVSSLALLVRA